MTDVVVSRRAFATGVAGLVLGASLPGLSRAQDGQIVQPPLAPNAFVHIAPDGTVTVLSKHIEFGQGPWTGLATLVAEELDADWSQIRVEHAPGDTKLYANLAMGAQLTGGSTAIANSYVQMRRVGAAARAMLVAAAAKEWDVPEGEIGVVKGEISHAASNHKSGFGPFAQAAAALTPPTDVTLKDPSKFTLIGRDLPKPDTEAKSTGKAIYSADLFEKDMVVALVAHPPRFGGKARSFDDSAAREIKGYLGAKLIPQGVAVYASSTYPAIKAREALKIDWDEGGAFTRGVKAIEADYRELAKTPGAVAQKRGDALSLLNQPINQPSGAKGGAQIVERDFLFPYLAHAPMEPLGALARVSDDGVMLHFGSQGPTIDQMAVAKALGVAPEKVSITVALAGGSFGRRATGGGEFAVEAATCARAYGKNVPVKLVYTREDDMRGGFYRPLYVHRMRALLGANGEIDAWHHTIVGQSIMTGTLNEPKMVKNGVDITSVEGASDLPYRIANFQCDLHSPKQGVPVLWWRSVGHTHTGYATESFIDLLLEKGGKDPIEGRIALLPPDAREVGVLKAVAEAAGWKGRLAGDSGYGVAVHKSFNTYVAQIVEVRRGADGLPKVTHVWCAVDCGVAVNPNIIRAQMEGGVGFGLGHALYAALDLDNEGRVAQSNFNSYRSLRMSEAPPVDVTIVKSDQPPTGVGEPGVPPIGPATANAWRALTGEMATRLPFARAGVA